MIFVDHPESCRHFESAVTGTLAQACVSAACSSPAQVPYRIPVRIGIGTARVGA